MSDTHLIAPHGGLSEPVNRMVADVETFLSKANGLTCVPVSDADLSSVYRFGDGGLGPLTGPMDAQTYHRVLDEAVIEVDGKRYAWTIPISLPVSSDLAKTLSIGQKVALENTSGEIVAVLDISDIFEWDKTKYLQRVYLTDRTDHPGADMVLNGDSDKTHLLGGKIQVLPQPKNPHFGQYVLSPREVRPLLAQKGWKPRCGISNAQCPASRPRIRAGIWSGNPPAPGTQCRRVLKSPDGRNQIRRCACRDSHANLRSTHRVSGIGRRG